MATCKFGLNPTQTLKEGLAQMWNQPSTSPSFLAFLASGFCHLRVQGLGLRVYGLGFRLLGLGFRV